MEYRRYRYVGPVEIAAEAVGREAGRRIPSMEDFRAWMDSVRAQELAEPFTYVVDVEGTLRLAPRRSEHVACAGGGEVLAAGEITFVRRADGWSVSEISNQSTGYCPDASCWPAVAEALNQAGLTHPGRFTTEFVFRHCPSCGELNLVKEEQFVCCLCDTDLPVNLAA